MLTVTAVQSLPNTRLRVTFSNQKTAEVDVSDYLNAPGYAALRQIDVFLRACPDEWGHGVEWPGDIGIPVTTLYRMAREQSGKAWPVGKFNAWMQRNGLSCAGAASALGVTRRTVIHYHTGSKPIPIMVGLACAGYEAKQVFGHKNPDFAGSQASLQSISV